MRRAVLAARAERLATRRPVKAHEGGEERCVLGAFADQRLAVPASSVRFVVPTPPITALPGLPAWLLGVAAPRGRLVTVADPRVLVGQPPAGPGQGGFLLVAQGRPGALGLLLDVVAGFGQIARQDLRPAPFDGALPLRGVLDDGTGLLDVDALLDDPRLIVRRAGT